MPETLPVAPQTQPQPIPAASQEPQPPSEQPIIPDVAALDEDQAAEVFQQLEVEELSEEQKVELVAEVQAAPKEVRQKFEETVDVFKGGLDSYVPLDSKIPVGQRRTLVAVGAVTMVAGAVTRVRR